VAGSLRVGNTPAEGGATDLYVLTADSIAVQIEAVRVLVHDVHGALRLGVPIAASAGTVDVAGDRDADTQVIRVTLGCRFFSLLGPVLKVEVAAKGTQTMWSRPVLVSGRLRKSVGVVNSTSPTSASPQT
jgi:hypothetical protein